MDDTSLPPRLTRLTFHGPLSEARAAQLTSRLSQAAPATVLDIGCGWGELMLRVLEATPGADGLGLDLNAEDLTRGAPTPRPAGWPTASGSPRSRRPPPRTPPPTSCCA